MNRWVQNKEGVLIPNREAGFIQPGIGLMNKKQGGEGAGDPYWGNVVSLCHYAGPNGSTVITDEVSGISWIAGSGTTISTTQYKFGTSSLLTGTGGSRTSKSVSLGGSPFTMESFIYTSSATLPQTAQKIYPTYPNFIINANNVQFSNGSIWVYGSDVTIPINQWFHLAASYTGSVLYFFVDGIMKGNITVNIPNTTGPLYVGADQSNNYVRGFMAESRITVGVARYTTNFTPPSAPFSNHA